MTAIARRAPWSVPDDLRLEGDFVSWCAARPVGGDVDPDEVLDTFLQLASEAYDSERIAGWVGRFGALELCEAHQAPAWHALHHRYRDDVVAPCPPQVRNGRRLLSLPAARNFSAALDSLIRLSMRAAGRKGSDGGPDWRNAQEVMRGSLVWDPNETGNWRFDRERIALMFDALLVGTGVQVGVEWGGDHRSRMGTELVSRGASVDSVLAIAAFQRSQQVKAALRCVVCGADLSSRTRPPRKGELTYCGSEPCRREQRRRNTAASRRRKREAQA